MNGASLLALATYRQALDRFPQSQPLAIATGRLEASLQQYDDAARLLRLAQTRDTPNSEIAYYLGIAEEGLGNERDAQASYEIAYRQADLRAPAAIRLAELHARQGDLNDAAILLRSATSAQPADLRAAEELEAVLRAQSCHEAAVPLPPADSVPAELNALINEVEGLWVDRRPCSTGVPSATRAPEGYPLGINSLRRSGRQAAGLSNASTAAALVDCEFSTSRCPRAETGI